MADTERRTGRHLGFHREHLLYLLHEIERVAEKAAPELSSDDTANVSARLIVVLSKIMSGSGEGPRLTSKHPRDRN